MEISENPDWQPCRRYSQIHLSILRHTFLPSVFKIREEKISSNVFTKDLFQKRERRNTSVQTLHSSMKLTVSVLHWAIVNCDGFTPLRSKDEYVVRLTAPQCDAGVNTTVDCCSSLINDRRNYMLFYASQYHELRLFVQQQRRTSFLASSVLHNHKHKTREFFLPYLQNDLESFRWKLQISFASLSCRHFNNLNAVSRMA